MFKIGINSAPRIVSTEVTETQEPSSQAPEEQIVSAETKNVSTGNSSIRSEAMFSAVAMRAQLTQQLVRNESGLLNPESLQNIKEIDRKAPLTAEQADRQINNKATYDSRKPLSKNDPWNGALMPKTLSTGDDDDLVDISQSADGRVHVNVNGKEAWSGTVRQFQALTIDTGRGNDKVNLNEVLESQPNYLPRARIGLNVQTGEGDDVINLNDSSFNTIDSGAGNDVVNINGSGANLIETGAGSDTVASDGSVNNYGNEINTGDGEDKVDYKGIKSNVNTGDGADWLRLSGADNNVQTGMGNDSVMNQGFNTNISTGDGDDYVENTGRASYIKTDDGNDWVDNMGEDTNVETGQGDDRINQKGGQGSYLEGGEGYDHVFIENNHDGSVTKGYWLREGDSSTGKDRWVPGEENFVSPIKVETDGNDIVFNSDYSKVIVDGEKK